MAFASRKSNVLRVLRVPRVLPKSQLQSAKRLQKSTNQTKGNETMKLEIDWAGMLKAAVKAIWPFIAGAVGGIGTNFL